MADVEKRMYDIAAAISAMENQSSKLQDTMMGLSQSKFWTVISRSASGILPGFWSVQNKLRAVTDVFVMYYQGQEKANKQVLAAIEAQAQLNEVLETYNEDLVASGRAYLDMQEAIKTETIELDTDQMLDEIQKLRDFHDIASREIKQYETTYSLAEDHVTNMIKRGEGKYAGLDFEKDMADIEILMQERAMKWTVESTLEPQKAQLDIIRERQITNAAQQEELEEADNPVTKWFIKQKHKWQNFLKLVGPVLRAGLKALKGALIWGTFIIFGLMVIVSIIKKMWPFLSETRKLIVDMIKLLLTGIVSVLVGLKEMLAGALTGDFTRFFSGLGTMVEGLISIGVALIVGTFGAVMAFAIEFLLGGIGKILKDRTDPLVSGWKTFFDWFASIASIVLIAVGLIFLFMTPYFWAGVAYLIGAAVVQAFAFAFGHADGGIVNEPMSLVGEKGPELVSLPKGTQVHTNAESTEMLKEEEPNVKEINTTNITKTENKPVENITNITVQIQGRVGASDAEIKDIANKVAHQINMRMNRTLSTPTRFA